MSKTAVANVAACWRATVTRDRKTARWCSFTETSRAHRGRDIGDYVVTDSWPPLRTSLLDKGRSRRYAASLPI